MDFQFVDESVIDKAVFGQSDPRRMPRIDPTICPTCQQRQSDDIRVNRCSCFPNLFGGIKIRSAVQIFNTGNAKNNGVLARSVSLGSGLLGYYTGHTLKRIIATICTQHMH